MEDYDKILERLREKLRALNSASIIPVESLQKKLEIRKLDFEDVKRKLLEASDLMFAEPQEDRQFLGDQYKFIFRRSKRYDLVIPFDSRLIYKRV
jgi:hypothetical protein